MKVIWLKIFLLSRCFSNENVFSQSVFEQCMQKVDFLFLFSLISNWHANACGYAESVKLVVQ